MRKLTFTTLLLALIALTECFAQSGDLEVVSIDPLDTAIPVGTTTELILVVNQNGPGDLPAGSARVNIAIDPNFVNWVEPVSISSDCGAIWSIHTANPTGATPQIQIRNNNGVLANGAGCEIRISVRGIAAGTGAITVTSTVFGPGVSDPNGTNQGATGTLIVEPAQPVTLISFEAMKENTTTSLVWATVEEVNSDHFQVQHSLDGKQWHVVGTVASHGESKVRRDYAFTHDSPSRGNNYYRLKMVDRDETFAYSSIRSLDFGEALLSVYPNPVSTRLFLREAAIGHTRSIELVSMSGNVVVRSGPVSSAGIYVSNVPSGIYLVRLLQNDGALHTHKVVISH